MTIQQVEEAACRGDLPVPASALGAPRIAASPKLSALAQLTRRALAADARERPSASELVAEMLLIEALPAEWLPLRSDEDAADWLSA
jgi:hypothetical protein